ncbi:MAG: DUF262 domain-containing HNH endonuclease family protein [Methanomassiliicoccaceae archaeon]|nr:DUF262 domain-containing HNH endonuclease family protein [Methanomassiliicoccaceae archaeon]
MKAITANPERIRVVFTKRYIIPDFQRPYSWEKETCEELWDDILNFFDTKETMDDEYFLGNIVINPVSGSDAWEVIDGQQRLTTLILLIKAMFSRASTVKALEECLRIKDPLTSIVTDELRVTSHVTSGDKENLLHIILHDAKDCPDCKLRENYILFEEKIDEWQKINNQSADTMNDLILTLLDKVVLLPINCDSEDDALTIFETINNRGISLSDADIFKARLYNHSREKHRQNEFINEWNAMRDHDWLFRVLMHIFRAEEGDYSKEVGMRSFFLSNSNNRFDDYDKVVNSLKKINKIETEWDGSDEINSFRKIMHTYPNYYWKFPLYVFLHKHGAIDSETDEFSLPNERKEEFIRLLETTIRYFFIKGVVHNTVNTVKDTVFRVCAKIETEDDYLSEYLSNLTKRDYDDFICHLKENRLGRYLRGIVLLSAYLNPEQNKTDFSEFIDGKYDIEHILPKKWHDYEGWSETTFNEDLNKIGNLIPLSKALNIAAKNEFFDRKKVEYKKSTVQDAIDLLRFKEWTPRELEQMQEEKISRLSKFFQIDAVD